MRHQEVPSITGFQLIKLLKKDGWIVGRKANHGRTMTKRIGNRTRVTFVPEQRASLPSGTLSAILSQKQTGIGRSGLLKIINEFGLK